MRIDSTGAVGIGTASLGSGYGLRVTKTLTDVTSGQGVVTQVTANSTITNLFGFNTSLNSATNSGTPYTITQFAHYNAAQGTVNADSTVTNQFGFVAASSLTGATNNYGFYSNIASGTNRWNFFANGTAANYFAGNVLIGSSTPSSTSYSVYVESTSGILTSAGSNTATVSPTIGTSRRRTGLASVVSGDSLGKFSGFGWDAASFVEAARIESFVDGTPGTNDMPGRLTFSTTADGAATPTERMRIDNAGNVVVNTAAIATTATDGFLYVPSCAGTPTGTPTTYTGRVPIVVDTTNHKLYFYSGGTWRDAGP